MSYYMARASKEILEQDKRPTKETTQDLEDHDRRDVDIIDEDIWTEDGGWELDRERAATTEYPAQYFSKRLEVQK